MPQAKGIPRSRMSSVHAIMKANVPLSERNFGRTRVETLLAQIETSEVD
jgi:hypothetical protein